MIIDLTILDKVCIIQWIRMLNSIYELHIIIQQALTLELKACKYNELDFCFSSFWSKQKRALLENKSQTLHCAFWMVKRVERHAFGFWLQRESEQHIRNARIFHLVSKLSKNGKFRDVVFCCISGRGAFPGIPPTG